MANKNFKARIGIEAPLIAADNGTTAITLTGANVAVAGTLDVQGGTITDSTGALQITTSSNGNLTLAPNGTGKVISGVTQLADNSMVMGSLLATTNSSYTFPSIPITRVSGNNGLDVASSTIIGNGSLGNAAQQQLTHYSGDILAGQGSFAGVVLRTANGNSVTGSTLPFTGLAQTAASGLVTGDTMGGFSFNGYATTDFTDFLGTRNQGGGFIGANSLQIQGLAAENFVDSTLTISGATITAVTRSSPGLSSVTVTGTRGQISFTATTPSVGQAVNVSGTNTGTSTGISAGTYYIVAVAGTTGATLSSTPGGVPITTTAGTTTGLTFARRWIVVTFTAQTYIPFGLQALVTVSGITGVTDGTYMAWGSGSTTTVNIGADTTSVSLSGTQSISTPTVTNAGSALRIRSIPVATPLNSSNRIDIIDHRPSAAIYRANSFTFNTGAYGNTGTSLLTIDSSGNVAVIGNLDVQGGTITESTGALSITTGAANGSITLDPNGTGNVIMTLADGGNLTNNRNYVAGAIRNATTASIGDIWAINSTGAVNPYRGISIDNSADTTKGAGAVMRSYSGGAGAGGGTRGRIIFEKARGTAASPTAVQLGDNLGSVDATGYTSTGWLNDNIAAVVPAFFGFASTENWVSNTNLGSRFFVSLTPTATTITSNANSITTIDSSPESGGLRSDRLALSQGKTAAFTATGCSTSGTTLTIGTLTSGTIAVGNVITVSTSSALQNHYIIANISGSGSGSTWTIGGSPGTLSGQSITGNTGIIGSNPVTSATTDILQDLRLVRNTVKSSSGTTQITTSASGTTLALAGNTVSINNAAGTALIGSSNISYNRVYGQWQYDATLTPAAANTAYAVPFQGVNAVIDFANIASAANTSQIIFGAAGMYKLQFSAQVQNSDNGADHQITFWWRKNGVDVSNSAGYFTVPKAGAASGALIIGWDNMAQSANATDYYELMYAVSDTALTLPFIAASAPRPGAASVFLTLVPIGA